MKKAVSLFTVIAVILSAFVFAVNAEPDADETVSEVIELPDQPVSDTDFVIRIVHTNDIHSRIEENEGGGIIGASKLKTIIDSFTADCDISLVLDSGDLYHGMSFATVSKGESVAEVAKLLGYDAITVGNHDWNYGKERLKQLVDLSGTVMIAGNVVNGDGEKFFENEFLIKTAEKDGKTVKVGLFGVVDPDIYRMTSPKLLQGLTYTDAAQYANEAAQALRDQGCDIVIALSHTYKPAELAEKVSGIDMWLCGHEHIALDTTVTEPDSKTAYVYEDGYYLYSIGCYEIDVDLAETGAKCRFKADHLDYEAASAYENNGEVVSLLADINERQSGILQQKAGYSPSDLDGVWEHLRIGETSLGRAVTSAYLMLTDADVAFENAGGIRSSVTAGDLTYGDIIAISPFGNMVVTKSVKGEDLLNIIETNIELEIQNNAANDSGEYDAWPHNSGSYIQLSGMTVKYDTSLENGHRIVSAYVGDKPLDKDAYYTVATNNYFAGSLPVLCDAAVLNEYNACEEALINYFSSNAETISNDVNTPRMIKVEAETETETEEETETEAEGTVISPATGEGETVVCATAAIFISAGLLALLSVSRKQNKG